MTRQSATGGLQKIHMLNPLPNRPAQLIAAMLLAAGFSPVLAWSVLIPGLEAQFDMRRMSISVAFGIAMVAGVIGIQTAQRRFDVIGATLFPLSAAALAAGGLTIMALGNDFTSALIGWGALFGAGAGVAVVTAFRAGELSLPQNPEAGIAYVAVALAAGLALTTGALAANAPRVGLVPLYWMLAAVVSVAGLLSAAVFFKSRTILEPVIRRPHEPEDRYLTRKFMVGAFLGGLAGALLIGHAYSIAAYFGAGMGLAVSAVSMMAVGLAAGGMAPLMLRSALTVRSFAGIAHILVAVGTVWILANPDAAGATLGLAVSGVGIGLTVGTYLVGFGLGKRGLPAMGQRGNVLITFGVAGLLGPLIGGLFAELTVDYRISVQMACVASVFALANAMRIPNRKTERPVSSG